MARYNRCSEHLTLASWEMLSMNCIEDRRVRKQPCLSQEICNTVFPVHFTVMVGQDFKGKGKLDSWGGIYITMSGSGFS